MRLKNNLSLLCTYGVVSPPIVIGEGALRYAKGRAEREVVFRRINLPVHSSTAVRSVLHFRGISSRYVHCGVLSGLGRCLLAHPCLARARPSGWGLAWLLMKKLFKGESILLSVKKLDILLTLLDMCVKRFLFQNVK